MNDINFIPGAIKDPIDVRDFQFGEEIGHASPPFDWDTGFDIEAKIGFKLKVKDQGTSSSCGGQAWSYAGQVWDKIIDAEISEKSAKFIYSQTFVQGGGSGGRENSSMVIKQGWGPEDLTPSYKDGLPLEENDYERPQDITPEARVAASKDRAFAYANVSLNIDIIAQALRDNNGVILGITGSNNGTWRKKFPLPPTALSGSWNHWLYAGKAILINGKKYIGVINSWGESTGENGWQYLSEEYLLKMIQGYPVTWSIWTIVAKTDPVPSPVCHVFTKTLRYGMTDPEVKNMQAVLQHDGCFPSTINTTNYFGSITLSSLKTFQKKYGLVADGVAGPKTGAKLKDISCG